MEEKTLGQLELDHAALCRACEIMVEERRMGDVEFSFGRVIEEYEEKIQKKKEEIGLMYD